MLLAALVVGACAPSGASSVPVAPARSTAVTLPPALADAIGRWHEHEELDPLARYVAAHPEEDLGVWREVVALHRYEACGTGRSDLPGLRTVAQDYPDTIGGRIAGITLLGDGLGRLEAEVPGALLVDFLDGGDAWARDASGASMVTAADAERARAAHGPALRDRLGRALLSDRCATTMGYCNWWLSRYPDAEASENIEAAVGEVWSQRAHPTWQSGEHARCAVRCVKRCRPRAAPLDDSCFAPCYSRC